MSKMSGKQSGFALMREDASRIIIGYGLKQVTDELYEWHEVSFYKKQKSSMSLQELKEAVIADINARTDERILSGFVWNGKSVWLSAENQTNFSAAEYTASTKNGLGLPVTFKLGEQDGTPVYHEFTTVEELSGFYLEAQAYIKQCLADGWQEKDGFDWTPYEALFPAQDDSQQSE